MIDPRDMPSVLQSKLVDNWQNKNLIKEKKYLANEVPVAFVFNGISHAVMMTSPSDLQDFAIGFSYTEGLISNPNDIINVESLVVSGGIELHLEVTSACEKRLKKLRRSLVGKTGCGLCGVENFKQVDKDLSPVGMVCVSHKAIAKANRQLQKWQKLNTMTRSTHAAAWCSLRGDIQVVREDVGRHNALDKLIGHLIQEHINVHDGFMFLTSRASFEMIQKSIMIGVGMLTAISAATALAVNLAKNNNMALAGFVRHNNLTVYTFPERFGF